jgi:hypothetical protein
MEGLYIMTVAVVTAVFSFYVPVWFLKRPEPPKPAVTRPARPRARPTRVDPHPPIVPHELFTPDQRYTALFLVLSSVVCMLLVAVSGWVWLETRVGWFFEGTCVGALFLVWFFIVVGIGLKIKQRPDRRPWWIRLRDNQKLRRLLDRIWQLLTWASTHLWRRFLRKVTYPARRRFRKIRNYRRRVF